MKYNITENDGEKSSVTVFIPGEAPLVATKEHPNFRDILLKLAPVPQTFSDAEIIGLFDQSVALAKAFDKRSDRVSVGSGRVYFDNMPVHNALTAEILRFHAAGLTDDLQPLVNFMEKIADNPLDHSREHLFTWLEKHDFGLAPDGDFYAYKGVDSRGFSTHSGLAIVNGETHNGFIPYPDGAVVEMPRDKVQHDPRQGCSTGLHVANYAFARGFGTVKLVKINPRDVVSVPTDAGGDKMRVCRLVVVGPVQMEDKSLLLRTALRTARTVGVADPNGKKVETHAEASPPPAAVASVPAKKRGARKAPVKKAAPKRPVTLPEYYEQMNAKHFATMPVAEVKWLAGEWEIVGRSKMTVPQIIDALAKEARVRIKTWK